jgi:hypothetical protein
MNTLIITILAIFGIFCLVIGLSIIILKRMKGSKLYHFVKRQIITDEDLENIS